MPSRRVILVAFVLVTLTNLVANATGATIAIWLTKPLLMPLLAAYLWRVWLDRRPGRATGNRLVLAALGFSTAGDIALLQRGTTWFITGMALFLFAHVCYVTAFVRAGAATRLRRPPMLLIPLGYAVIAVAALTLMWDGLTQVGLALPIAGYSVLLAATASGAAAIGWRTGVGGALFLTSDLLIAVRLAGFEPLPGPPVWVMASYAAGQALLILGWASRGHEADGPAQYADGPAQPSSNRSRSTASTSSSSPSPPRR